MNTLLSDSAIRYSKFAPSPIMRNLTLKLFLPTFVPYIHQEAPCEFSNKMMKRVITGWKDSIAGVNNVKNVVWLELAQTLSYSYTYTKSKYLTYCCLMFGHKKYKHSSIGDVTVFRLLYGVHVLK